MGRAFVNDKLAIDNNWAVWAVKVVHKIHERISLMELSTIFFYLRLSVYVHLYNLKIYN